MTRSKKLIANAREDKARRLRLELDELQVTLDDACTVEEQTAAGLALSAYYEEREADQGKKDQLKEAKLEARRAKREAGASTSGRPRIQWVDGGRDMVPGISKRGKEFFAAASGNLVKCSREISRWETDNAYDNVRGVKKGEIVMVISDHRMGDNKKEVVDIMAGPDIVRGVPAGALRPLE